MTIRTNCFGDKQRDVTTRKYVTDHRFRVLFLNWNRTYRDGENVRSNDVKSKFDLFGERRAASSARKSLDGTEVTRAVSVANEWKF